VALLALASTALATDKYDKDNSLPPAETRGTLDCSNAIDAGCGFNYSGNNAGGAVNTEFYNCQPYSESGPENVFRLTLGATTNVTVTMAPQGCDLDLFVLASCDENDCIGSSAGTSTETVVLDCLAAGTYYVVVDGYAGAACGYTLSISCTDCSGPVENENCGSCAPLACGAIDMTVDTRSTNNDYDPGAGNSCTGYSASGGDLVWCVCIPANGGTIDLSVEEVDYDASVYLVTDCADPVGSCLSGSDCYPWPCFNSIFYTNGSGADINAYLIIDGFGGGAGTTHVTGTLDCCGGTPTEETSWGSVKARFSAN
jgi:hypothetical protein